MIESESDSHTAQPLLRTESYRGGASIVRQKVSLVRCVSPDGYLTGSICRRPCAQDGLRTRHEVPARQIRPFHLRLSRLPTSSHGQALPKTHHGRLEQLDDRAQKPTDRIIVSRALAEILRSCRTNGRS